jgi:3-oxoacyl-[acyl-carrier protein] reductase
VNGRYPRFVLAGGPQQIRSGLGQAMEARQFEVLDAGERLTDIEGEPVVGVVLTFGDGSPLPLSLLADQSEGQWVASAETPILEFLTALQCAHRSIAASGGTVMCVVPSCGITGAPGLVPVTTAVEGVRALVKSAARQWGAEGVGVHWAALPIRLWDESAGAATSFVSPPAVEATSEMLLAGLAAAIETFASAAGQAFNGSGLVLDGGSTMAP